MSGEVKNILIVGVGGQGIVLAADILSQVLVRAEYDVKTTEIRGQSRQGGGVNAMIRFGSKVYSPIIEEGKADYILAFEQIEALRWSNYLKPGGILIMNTETIKPLSVLLGKAEYPKGIEETLKQKGIEVIAVDANNISERAGSKKAANIVLLGCLAAIMPISRDVWHACIESRVPSLTIDISKEAFSLGYELISQPAFAT